MNPPFPYEPHHEDDEREPLTPRFAEDGASTGFGSTSTAESSRVVRTTGYLQFFRSPPPPATAPPSTFDDSFGVDNRTRTPMYPMMASAPRESELHDQTNDDEDIENADPQQESSYLPQQHFDQPRVVLTPRNHHSNRLSRGSSVKSTRSNDSRSVFSPTPNLFGETIGSPPPSFEADSVSTRPSVRRQSIASVVRRSTFPVPQPSFRDRVGQWRRQVAMRIGPAIPAPNPMPLSPRSRNLQDLTYLLSQHKRKMRDIAFPEEEDFDFCLVLSPQEVYSYWTDLLDFREELLCQESWGHLSARPIISNFSADESEARDEIAPMTPSFTHRHQASFKNRTPMSAPSTSLLKPSPGMQSLADTKVSASRLSVFQRAVCAASPGGTTLNDSLTDAEDTDTITNLDATPLQRRRWGNHVAGRFTVTSPPIRSLTRGSSAVRRPTLTHHEDRLREDDDGEKESTDPNVLRIQDIPNQVIPRGIAARTNGLLQFLSALRRGIVVRRHRSGHEAAFVKILSTDGGDTIQFKTIDIEDAMTAFREQRVRYNKSDVSPAQSWSHLPDVENQTEEDNRDFTVPDYVAAQQYREKTSREFAVGKKVQALAKHVVRTANVKAADMIAIHPAQHNDPRSENGELGTASLRRSKARFSSTHSFSLILRSGKPFRNGTESLDDYEQKWYRGEGPESMFKYIDFETATEGEYWLIFRGFLLLHRDAAVGRFAAHRAAGIGSHYRRLELEQREQLDLDAQNVLHEDEFHEPKTIGCIERAVMRCRDIDPSSMAGYTRAGAVPPPSDYFLGFKGAGTSIWSRLRQAGLETHRVYSLDPRRVMIKIRCPSDRLIDVAEVLRIKLKTTEGSYAPFREEMIDMYQSQADPLEGSYLDDRYFHFRSSIRQSIIDFIIGSRIRDSGAELGQTTELGKMIQARVPLHMPEKVDAICKSWVYFWRRENWEGRDARSMTHEAPTTTKEDDEEKATLKSGDSSDSNEEAHRLVAPNLFQRLVRGCLHQPLDSVEQYFGEKVAFYFAWLQHTAAHLVVLSVVGVLMFIIQVSSGKWDHPLRPFFSMFVMLWTFTVLVNWKKRANFLAHRWGTMDYKEQEVTRPQFQGEYTRDEITGEWITTYPHWKRWVKYAISFPITLLFTAGTLMLILVVHGNRDLQLACYVERHYNTTFDETECDWNISKIGKKSMPDQELTREVLLDPKFWYITVGLPALLGLCLPLLNFLLMKLSVMLNNFENYRTESEYRTFLIIKVFSFRFVCYFATLYYYAFVSTGSPEAIENGIFRVGTGVFVYTTVTHWWQVFLHVYFPILIRRIRMHLRGKRLTEELRILELEEEDISRQWNDGNRGDLHERNVRLINKRLLLQQAQDDVWLEVMRPAHDSFPEYIQAVVQFTYVSCFSVVLPITPLICLINYLIGMRLDGFKLCKGRRRPLAEKTGGIGIWEHLLHLIAVFSVLTNCWMMGFTNASFIKLADKIGEVGLFAIVVAWEHVMLLIKYIMQSSVSSLPKSVRDELKREQYEKEQQRNKSMRTRKDRRSQFHRESAESALVCSPQPTSTEAALDDDASHVGVAPTPAIESPPAAASSKYYPEERLLFSA